MKDLFVLAKRIDENVTILLQARNLTGYALAMTTAGEAQGAITQINQRLNVAIGGLNQIVEEIRYHKPQQEALKSNFAGDVLAGIDPIIFHFLSPTERADLGQLEHSFNELTIARDLVDKFRQRLYELAKKRSDTSDYRGQNL